MLTRKRFSKSWRFLLSQDIFKTSSNRLQGVFKISSRKFSRRFQDDFKTSSRHVARREILRLGRQENVVLKKSSSCFFLLLKIKKSSFQFFSQVCRPFWLPKMWVLGPWTSAPLITTTSSQQTSSPPSDCLNFWKFQPSKFFLQILSCNFAMRVENELWLMFFLNLTFTCN